MEGLFPEIIIAGVGNELFGDDGFGPAVIRALSEYKLPDNVKAMDVGLGGPHLVFSMIEPKETKKLIIVDCMDFGGKPGELTKIPADLLPESKQERYMDAHSGNLLDPISRLKEKMDIIILGCQPAYIPAPDSEDFALELSPEVQGAIPKTVNVILKEIES
ncbi:MAG TPA: coenzyme F420-reducing hydrogenase, FrhD protein [Methanocorpusculum sp.]|nr:coenzyme F420-reducing hydrogenase, FrhD protein [Methanocorpusculum sp.]HJJ89605.1 coenzyme F420-reducing hydrogenase, FrhD protein [Methanocorpusculum sp.]HJJ90695.1 coenzyme F420-reducing hydrogenase, FrhD protein [Methanocorpusculum sp.]HJJ92341.1 coenzyme F420-reducing hydrogenase, FrhD protein [Methanocorpusculum sp.]HJK01214.1 coenzyme F420-reducing hydrogenase, FrhD protein [Methanocorpusculum sp.]